MGSRLLPVALTLSALLADAGGAHRVALYLVLLAIPGAAAAAFLGAGDMIVGKPARLRGVSACIALTLLVVGSAVRENAPTGGHVPALALSTIVGALLCYLLPAVVWVLEPLAPRPAPVPARARARAARVDA
jgi:hypothetical protein